MPLPQGRFLLEFSGVAVLRREANAGVLGIPAGLGQRVSDRRDVVHAADALAVGAHSALFANHLRQLY